MACMNDGQEVRTADCGQGFFCSFFATSLLWVYFLGVGIFFIFFLYLPSYLIAGNKEHAFQRINSLFYQGFFFLVRLLFPRHRWRIDERIHRIKSSVVLCNHTSYLDPLILIALFDRQKTIVKSKFFNFPVFGWLLRGSGYIPASTKGRFAGMMIDQVEKMDNYLTSGGVLFVFPEGTRSRTGSMGQVNKGAFKIARLSKAPLVFLTIKDTDKLFPPDRFMFSGAVHNTITVTLTGVVEPDNIHKSLSSADFENLVRQFLSPVETCRNVSEEY